MFYSFLFIFIIKKYHHQKTKKTLHLTFEKIKWSVYNINELSFVALSGLEPEQTESQILVHFQIML